MFFYSCFFRFSICFLKLVRRDSQKTPERKTFWGLPTKIRCDARCSNESSKDVQIWELPRFKRHWKSLGNYKLSKAQNYWNRKNTHVHSVYAVLICSMLMWFCLGFLEGFPKALNYSLWFLERTICIVHQSKTYQV